MECRVCDGKSLEQVLDLGSHPWGNDFLKKEQVGKEAFYPLRVVFCNDCHTAQLDYTVKKEIMFADHTYLSGTTRTLNRHFKQLAEDVDARFMTGKKDKSVLDLGSNDGTQLQHYKNMGYEVLGVESSVKTAQLANSNQIPTLHAFYNLDTAKDITKKFDVINASGFFFHLEELHSVTDGIRENLKKDGVFVVQFIYMKQAMQNMAFDQIYHEHLLYYNLQTIETLLNRHGLEMFDAYMSPIHGGSIMGFVGHQGARAPSYRLEHMRKEEDLQHSNDIKTYHTFAKKVEEAKQANLEFISKVKAEGKTIFGFGAPVKGNTLLNYFGLDTRHIDFLIEKNPLRNGLYSPGSHIPIIMEDDVKKNPDIYYVLAWNFKNEILNNNKHLMQEGVNFYFPVNPKEEW